MLGFFLVLVEHFRRTVDFALRFAGSALHLFWRGTGSGGDCLRLSSKRSPSLVVTGAPRLSEHLCQAGRRSDAGRRDSFRTARNAASCLHPIHRRLRSYFCREDFPLLLHHHRLRGDFRISFIDILRHDAQDDCQGVARLACRLRLHAAGKLCRHHGHDCRLCFAAGRLFCGEFSGGNCRRHAGSGCRDHQFLGISRYRGRHGRVGAATSGNIPSSTARVGRLLWLWAWPTFLPKAEAEKPFWAFGITSPSCSKRCSFSPSSMQVRE